jgi:ABC-type transport system involved in Fe-S cluster assembly fused permease/ATPase subunit
VQKAIRDLSDTTVLMIAHKLENVLDLDKILVLSEGQIQVNYVQQSIHLSCIEVARPLLISPQ